MKSNRTFLITGGAGFVGAHMVEHILKTTQDDIIVVDALTYAGTFDRLRDIKINPNDKNCTFHSAYNHPRVRTVEWNIQLTAEPNLVKELQDVTHILHMAAESHVDNSIADPLRFVITNVQGTCNMLNFARQLPNLELFHYMNTDEVFGPAPLDEDFKGYKETDLHTPTNPYSATKSAGGQLVTAFANTYNLPCIQTYTMNIMGERQHPEKFIPICIRKALYGGKVTIHGTPDCKQAGSRSYIHGRNLADALMFIINNKPYKDLPVRSVDSYNIVGEEHIDNLTLARFINETVAHVAEEYGMVAEGAEFEIVDFHSSRQGHDIKYLLDGSKMKELGWEPPKSFRESLTNTIRWYLKPENLRWLNLK